MHHRHLLTPLLIACALVALTGCTAGAVTGNTPLSGNGIVVQTIDPESQLLLMKGTGEATRVCLGHIPDAIGTASQGIVLGGRLQGFGEEGGRGAVDLGGRSPALLIARELLLRTCEISINYNLDRDAALQLYREVLDKIESISAANTSVGTAPITAEAISTNLLTTPATDPDAKGDETTKKSSDDPNSLFGSQ